MDAKPSLVVIEQERTKSLLVANRFLQRAISKPHVFVPLPVSGKAFNVCFKLSPATVRR